VRLGTTLKIADFDQMREQLDPERSVAETISPGSDFLEIDGRRKHVISYLGDFLFAPRRAEAPVKMLSGGERNRLLLARLFARPTNLLVLDEPTNDLDMESLELLEQALQDYAGTILLVSHDRRFLDNIVTQTLASEGRGRWREYVGGYADWLAQRGTGTASARAARSRAAPEATRAPASERERPRTKLSYKEQRELDALPGIIEALEQEQAQLVARMSAPDYHRQPPPQLRDDRERAQQLEAQLAEKFARWERLEHERSSFDA
jgi:ATP-binding cassette subfamily F protein uup